MEYRNYCLRILHQLGETSYIDKSLFVSSSTNVKEAKKFSNNEIIIYFWDFTFTSIKKTNNNLPYFIGRPYKTQKEISILNVIFPHYIYLFRYLNKDYINPALFTTHNLEIAILNGFEINQSNFSDKKKEQTDYNSGLIFDGKNYTEIK